MQASRSGRRAIVWTALGLGLPTAAVLGALALALSDQAAVTQQVTVAPADIARVHGLLQRNRPSQHAPGALRAVWLGERDLELLLAEASRRVAHELRPQVTLGAQTATLRLSMAAPANPFGHWLNLEATAVQTDGLPTLDRLRLGRLPVPPALALWAVQRAIKAQKLEAQSDLALKAVNRVSFRPKMAVVVYAWPGERARQVLADALLAPADQVRIKVYAQRIGQLVNAPRLKGAPKGVLPLSQVLPPLMRLAQARTSSETALHGSAAEENRAALLALTLMSNPSLLYKLVPGARQWGPLPRYTLSLRGRPDFPLHWLVSAVLATEAGGPLADAVGVYKEMADSQGGSGFSFNDIAADRAGTRTGLLALSHPELLQQRLGSVSSDDELLPPVDDLPEFLSAAEFAQRYGAVGAPAYQAMSDDIERRLDRLALLKPAPG